MLYRDNKSCESTKIRPIRLTHWPESHLCLQTWHIRDILCTCNKLASSQQVFHPLSPKTETRLISRDVSVRDVSDMSYLFCFPVKFSDAIVRLLYPFLVADMAMQLM